jgi:hypothetical protein
LKELGADLTDSYKEMIKKVPCTCGKACSVILNNLPKTYFDNFQFYANCPRVMMCCARRVLNQHNLPDRKLCNDFTSWFLKYKAPELSKSIKKHFKVDLIQWFADLKTKAKQEEVLRFVTHAGEFDYQFRRYYPIYSAFVKAETQLVGEKPRQIGCPSNSSKYVGMPANKAIEEILKDVYGDAFGLGRSYEDRAKIINKYHKTHFFATLDVSGMDQSHNDMIKQPWYWFIDEILRLKEDEIKKYANPDLFYAEYCKSVSAVSYDTVVHGKYEHLFTIFIRDKMVSGSAYTSVLNTFLMMNLCEYTGYLLKTKFVAHTSGDDVCVFIPNYISDMEARKAFYRVFSWPDFHEPHGCGLYLKYCVISHDVRDIKPCSTEVFCCPQCGVKVVRPLYKLFFNYFVSHKYYLLRNKISLMDYRRIVYQGDLAWANGLTIAEIFLRAIGRVSTKNLSELCNLILEVTKKDPKILVTQGELISVNRTFLNDFVYDTYAGKRVSINMPCCNKAYERMIFYKYRITRSMAYKIANAITLKPRIGAYWLSTLTARYNDYDEANCKPPTRELMEIVHPGYKKTDYKVNLLKNRSCWNGIPKPKTTKDKLVYPRREVVFYGAECLLINQYVKSINALLKKKESAERIKSSQLGEMRWPVFSLEEPLSKTEQYKAFAKKLGFDIQERLNTV